jgi:hypothetical protein
LTLSLELPFASLIVNPVHGNFTVSTCAREIGHELRLILVADSTTRTPTWPAWIWMSGFTAPASIAANKALILSLLVVGKNGRESDIRAASVSDP